MSSFRVKLDRESVKKWRKHYLLYPKLSRSINVLSEMTSKGSRFNRNSDLAGHNHSPAGGRTPRGRTRGKKHGAYSAQYSVLGVMDDKDMGLTDSAEYHATEKYFLTLFQSECKRVDVFYQSQLAIIRDQVEKLIAAAGEKSGDGKLLHDWVLHGTKAVGRLKQHTVHRSTSRRPSRMQTPTPSGKNFKSTPYGSPAISRSDSPSAAYSSSINPGLSGDDAKVDMSRVQSSFHGARNSRARTQSVSVVIESTQTLSHAFVSIFKEVLRIERFALLNLTGFVRIWKKYEVVEGGAFTDAGGDLLRADSPARGDRGLLADMHATEFAQLRGLTSLMQETEQAYAEFFCGGNTRVAKADLHAVTKGTNDYADFYKGIKFGAMLLLALWVLWDVVVDAALRPHDSLHWRQNVFPVYRAVFCLLFGAWCWGLNCYVWHANRINYIYLFRLNPGSAVTYRDVFDHCTHWTLFVLTTFLLYYKTERGDLPGWVPAQVWPIVTFIPVFLRLLWFLRSHSRGHTNGWRLGLLQVVGAPFTEVTFLAGYIGDVLTSLVKVYADIYYSLCWLGGGWWLSNQDSTPNPVESVEVCLESSLFVNFIAPLLAALPLWWRLMQNLRTYYDVRKRFPSLANAGKYATGMSVVIFGIFQITNSHQSTWDPLVAFYLACLIISTLYNYIWDVFMDWGLGKSEHGYLREKRMFTYRAYYYLAIVVDFVLRFGWTLTLVPSTAGIPLSRGFVEYTTPFLAAGEIARRAMWGCFRLENEHIKRTSEHKDLAYIPLYFESRAAEQSNMNVRRIALEVIFVMALVISLGVASIVVGNN